METERREVSTGVAFLWMAAYTGLTTAGIIGLNHLLMPQRNGLAIFGVWLLTLILIFVLAGIFHRRTGGRGWIMLLVIGYAVYSCVYGVMLGHVPRLFLLRESPRISVREADRAAYDVYHFSDGRVEVSLVARTQLSGRNGPVYYRVAPLVPADWKRGDPITAWVGDSGLHYFLPASWAEDCRGGYRLGLDTTYEDLVRNHVRLRSLPSSPTAPILEWSRDPKAGFVKEGWIELSIILALDLLGLASVFAGKRFKTGAPASSLGGAGSRSAGDRRLGPPSDAT